jgi:EAL domain-containing protein (putative c-di-GMP-specific phosphodiesterase class I)
MGDRETDGTWWVHDIEASKNGPGGGPAEHELCLDFQPRFSLENGRLCGAEALARWDHPILGRLAAAEFVGEAEANRFVGDLDAFVIAAACVQLKKWESGAGLPPGFSLSVNISAQDLDDPGFARRTASAMARSGAGPGRLRLEVTCTSIGGHGATALAVVGELRDLDVAIDLDAIGVGFITTTSLQHLCPGKICMDPTGFADLRDLGGEAVLASMARLIHHFDALAVAKGIETAEVLSWMKGLGYDEAQGFLLGRPAPPADLVPALSEACQQG